MTTEHNAAMNLNICFLLSAPFFDLISSNKEPTDELPTKVRIDFDVFRKPRSVFKWS